MVKMKGSLRCCFELVAILSISSGLGWAQEVNSNSSPPALAMRQTLLPAGDGSAVSKTVRSLVTLPTANQRTPVSHLETVISGNAAASGVVFTCDASVNAVAGVCTYLNTTIAALYIQTFTNANASIYIMFGTAGLSQNLSSVNGVSYTSFRNALIATKTSTNDATGIVANVPAANPFGSDQVLLTNAHERALGFSPTFGLTTAGTSCSLGQSGCYDSILTVNSTFLATNKLYFRTGQITSQQYDFYTAVEHETDEILGTTSCGFGGCDFSGTTLIEPSDLFRFHSNRTRSLVAGTNNPCTASDTTNACFSLDGTTMLQHYNNLDNGEDAGDWAPNCAMPHVQDSELCAGVANLDISPSAEILVLDVVGYTLTSTSKVGVFRSGYFWLEDVDGNQQFSAPPDRAFAFGGIAGDIPITGDWNGSGTSKVGIYRPSNGLFILDSNGDGVFGAGDAVYNLGVGAQPGDVPVVGDWNGDHRTKVGLFRQGFFWILDYNGNGVFEQGTDKTYAFGGVSGDSPVVGDWNGSGTSKIGLFRMGFFWILDANGNGTLDNVNGSGGDQAFAYGGISGDVPVVGDWNGSGTSKVGVFRSGFFWVLDANGNHTFDGTAAGEDLAFPFGGISGDVPIVGKW